MCPKGVSLRAVFEGEGESKGCVSERSYVQGACV